MDPEPVDRPLTQPQPYSVTKPLHDVIAEVLFDHFELDQADDELYSIAADALIDRLALDWWSICSSHRHRDMACGRCDAGHWTVSGDVPKH